VVDAAEFAAHRGDAGADGVAVREIEGHGEGLAAGVLDLLGNALTVVQGDVGDGDGRACLRQRAGDGFTDAAAAAGDDGFLA
jgi:hypothetical protein